MFKLQIISFSGEIQPVDVNVIENVWENPKKTHNESNYI